MRIGIVCPYAWDVPGGVQFHKGQVAVQGIMLPHRGNQGAGQVNAHLPVQPLSLAAVELMYEGGVGGQGEIDPHLDVAHVLGDPPGLSQGVHPLRQVVIVLPIPLPLQPSIVWLLGSPLGKRLAYAKTPGGRPLPPLLLAQAAYPARPFIVRAEPPQGEVHLFDEPQSQFKVRFVLAVAVPAKIVAYRVRVGPEIAPGASLWLQSGPAGEVLHEQIRRPSGDVFLHRSLKGYYWSGGLFILGLRGPLDRCVSPRTSCDTGEHHERLQDATERAIHKGDRRNEEGKEGGRTGI